MIVPVISESGEIVEWGLVELQGKVEQQLEHDSSKPMPIGTIQISPAVRVFLLVCDWARQLSSPSRSRPCWLQPILLLAIVACTHRAAFIQ
jgi:hypothetical protein